jgi:hypothetical protein
MRFDDWPILATADCVAAYRAVPDRPGELDVCGGEAGSDEAAKVHALWSAVRAVQGAEMMVLKSPSRTWVAAGALLVEGKPGMNIGLLMPALRGQPQVEFPAAALRGKRPETALYRTLWDIAERIDRTEINRVMEFEGPGPYRIHAARSRFDLIAGDSLAAFLADVSAAVDADRPVKYTLRPVGAEQAKGRHAIADLFCKAGGQDVRLGDDGWPVALPEWTTMRHLQLATDLCDRFKALAGAADSQLTAFDGSRRQCIAAMRDGDSWSVRFSAFGEMR